MVLQIFVLASATAVVVAVVVAVVAVVTSPI
jgi:hypothetical protein